jgi:nucleoside-diphosphate-sugar epimerase
MQKSVLITGVTGLIGNYLYQYLLKHDNYIIRGQYVSNRNIDTFVKNNVEMFKADICKPEQIFGICEYCDIVVHSAAKVIDYGTKKEFYEAHYDATSYLLQDALKHEVKHFIYISSFGVASGLPRTPTLPNEDTPLVKTGIPYDDAKIDTETLVIEFCTTHKMDYTIVRPSAVIGTNSVWVNEPIQRMSTAMGLKLIDNGKNDACLIDAENLAHGIYLCMKNPKAKNQTFFFCDDWHITWKQYFTDLAAMAGKKLKGSIPYNLAYFFAILAEFIFPKFNKKPPLAKKSVQATGSDRRVDTSKARKLLGWNPSVDYSLSMQRIKASLQG